MNAVATTAEPATAGGEISKRNPSKRHVEAMVFGISALVFAGGAAATVVWSQSMPAMGAMAMPGGWTMSMTWMMQRPEVAHAVPLTAGIVVALAGALQLTAWKRRNLACCTEVSKRDRSRQDGAVAAWREGWLLGVRCSRCCGNLMLILLIVGIMDLRAMAGVTAAITIERLAPRGAHAPRAIGAVAIAAALILIARAMALA